MKAYFDWRSIIRLVFILGILGLISSKADAQSSWEIDKEKDSIIVYTRVETDSDFKSFKAEITLVASVKELIEILKDADNYIQWYGYTKMSRILHSEYSVQYNYVETKFPWPYSNRDMVYCMSIDTVSRDIIEISLKGIIDYIPSKKGIVRMKKAEGSIILKSCGSKTQIIYTFHSEPGGDVPPWLANSSIAEMPFRTLSGLRKMISKQQPNCQQINSK